MIRLQRPLTTSLFASLAEVMVPSLERTEYLEEVRNIVDNIVRERLEHSEVLPASHSTPVAEVTSCAVPQADSQSPCSISTAGNPGAACDVQPRGEPPAAEDTRQHVGPAFDIPMTQGKSLEDLPSQLDFEWQDSVSPNSTPAHVTARSLGGELDVVGTSRPITVDTFVQVSQIAREAVLDATLQPPSQVPHSACTPTDFFPDAAQI